jgi:thiosulfate dehydrogenase
MKHPWLFLLAATLCITGSIADRSIAGSGDIDLTRWTPPDIATVADDPFGTLVKYGHRLFTDTANEIGPTVSDQTRRFAGNNLACQNCHLQGGTQPYAMPLLGIWA